MNRRLDHDDRVALCVALLLAPLVGLLRLPDAAHWLAWVPLWFGGSQLGVLLGDAGWDGRR